MKKKTKRKYTNTKTYFIPACGLESNEIVTLIADNEEELKEGIEELEQSLNVMQRIHKIEIL